MDKQKDYVENLIDEIKEEIIDSEKVLVREIKAFGNTGHVTLSKEDIGKRARIIISDKKGSYTEVKFFKKEEGAKK